MVSRKKAYKKSVEEPLTVALTEQTTHHVHDRLVTRAKCVPMVTLLPSPPSRLNQPAMSTPSVTAAYSVSTPSQDTTSTTNEASGTAGPILTFEAPIDSSYSASA